MKRRRRRGERRRRGRPRRTGWASFVIQHPQMAHGQRLDLERADADAVDHGSAGHPAADRQRPPGGGPESDRSDGERSSGAGARGLGWVDDGSTHAAPSSIAGLDRSYGLRMTAEPVASAAAFWTAIGTARGYRLTRRAGLLTIDGDDRFGRRVIVLSPTVSNADVRALEPTRIEDVYGVLTADGLTPTTMPVMIRQPAPIDP